MNVRGLYFEECETDRIYTTDRRTVTEADHINFMTSYGFFESFFMDYSDQESNTHFAGRVVPGALTFCLSEGLTILSGILHETGMAFLEVALKVLKPVFIGDTLSVEIEIVDKRETSKADRGIVTYRQRVKNQNDQLVLEYTIKRMIRRKKTG
jgi:acyl dehydratase